MNKKTIVKVMGLPRSGTNALNVILTLNFNNYICGIQQHCVDFLGWKHTKAPDINTIKLIEKRTNDDVKFVFVTRDFEDWQSAIVNRFSGVNSSEFTTYSFGDDGFIFNTPFGGEFYETIGHFYKDRVASYQKFVQENDDRSILIDFKELKNQEVLLEKIRKKFNLVKSSDNYLILNKKVTFNNTITGENI